MQRSLIRKEALEQLTAPDELDRLMQVTGPKSWLALVALCAFAIGAVVWGFAGSVPVQVESGGGILLKPGSVREVMAQDSGIVSEVGVGIGDTVEEGQVVARLQSAEGGVSDVVSVFDGAVTEILVQEGMLVDRGMQVAVLEQGDEPLQAVMYVPIDEGKSIEEGVQVHVSPSTAPAEEFGYMQGRVSSVAGFPTPERQMALRLDNEDLAQSLHDKGDNLEVTVDLVTDPSTPSGFTWSSPQGSPARIPNGTPATATFVLGEQRPAELMLPSVR